MLEERLQKRYSSLTRSQKKVAAFFLSQGEEAAFMTISRLARRVKTSEATILRFTRSIGYRGYPHLQKDLQDWIKQKISPPRALQKAIVKEQGQDIHSRIFEMDLHNLNETREANGNEVIDKAVEELIRARKVGMGGFAAPIPLPLSSIFSRAGPQRP